MIGLVPSVVSVLLLSPGTDPICSAVRLAPSAADDAILLLLDGPEGTSARYARASIDIEVEGLSFREQQTFEFPAEPINLSPGLSFEIDDPARYWRAALVSADEEGFTIGLVPLWLDRLAGDAPRPLTPGGVEPLMQSRAQAFWSASTWARSILRIAPPLVDRETDRAMVDTSAGAHVRVDAVNGAETRTLLGPPQDRVMFAEPVLDGVELRIRRGGGAERLLIARGESEHEFAYLDPDRRFLPRGVVETADGARVFGLVESGVLNSAEGGASHRARFAEVVIARDAEAPLGAAAELIERDASLPQAAVEHPALATLSNDREGRRWLVKLDGAWRLFEADGTSRDIAMRGDIVWATLAADGDSIWVLADDGGVRRVVKLGVATGSETASAETSCG